MIETPPQAVYRLKGAPSCDECGPIEAPHGCRVCGGSCVRGMAYEDWGGSATTTPSRVREYRSRVVCEACVAICARYSPCPPRPAAEGKEAPRWGNYSVLCDDRGMVIASKGEKPVILAWLRAPKIGRWFAAIAESGQKHVLPWARWSLGDLGVIRFEERDLSTPESFALVDAMVALLTAGATKETIESGEYSAHQWQRVGPQIEAFEAAYGGERGGDWFALALWLAQRDEAEVEARIAREKEVAAAKKAAAKETKKREPRVRKDPARLAGGVAPRAAPRVPSDRSERDHALGPAPDTHDRRSAHDRDGRGLGQQGPVLPAPRSPEPRQLSLLDGLGAGDARGAREGRGHTAAGGAASANARRPRARDGGRAEGSRDRGEGVDQ